MVKGEMRLTIPNPHHGDIDWSLMKRILQRRKFCRTNGKMFEAAEYFESIHNHRRQPGEADTAAGDTTSVSNIFRFTHRPRPQPREAALQSQIRLPSQ